MEAVSTYELYRIKWPAYSNDGVAANVPKRLGVLTLDAATALPKTVLATDFYRSPQQQIRALRERRGAQWPGYSGHGEGISVDLDVSASMKLNGFPKKKDLDAYMREYGWVCHLLTKDGRGFEEWHYNYLPEIAKEHTKYGARSLDELEAEIKRRRKPDWDKFGTFDTTKDFFPKDTSGIKNVVLLQWALQKCGFYDGEIDGLWGKHSRAAFAHATMMWGAKNHSTKRVLAFISANVKVLGEVGTNGVNHYAEAEPVF